MKRIMKRQPIIKNINNYIYDAIMPINIDYWYNIGAILGLILIIQIITGIILSMYYVARYDLAFESVIYIKKEINYGYLIQNIHSNGAFMFFFMTYLHIARNLIYGSYTYYKIGTWLQGIIILLLLIITAFLGYSLPLGNMSLWAIAVITNLLTILPYGHDIVNYIYGGFTINDSTIGRFYTLHYLLPLIIAVLAIGHLITLHNKGGSNPLGLNTVKNLGGIRFHPYFIFKDVYGYFFLLLIFFYLVFYNSDYFNHSDNFIEANPLVTPSHIVPEIYLLPFYSILRAIPNKTLGVIALLSSILILSILPFIHLGLINTLRLRPLYKYIIYLFFINFLLLIYTGGALVEEPFITISQLSTFFYFSFFLLFTPFISFFESFIFYSYKYLSYK
jgi:ubiquinol-cytochrome c reductase cytochrome b subunit